MTNGPDAAWLLPLWPLGFIAFWCGVCFLLAQVGGQRLLPDFGGVPVAAPGYAVGLGQASVGLVSY